jgi:hypothetical protein
LSARASGVRSQGRSATTMAWRGPGIHAGGQSGRGALSPPLAGVRSFATGSQASPLRARAFAAFWRVVSAPGGLRGGVRSPRGFIGAANDDRGARAQRTALFACAATLGTPNTRALDAQRGVRRKFRQFFVLSVFEGNKKSLRAVAGEVRRSGRTINKQSGPDMTFGQPIKDWVVRI